ncbi:MAG: hypothetical protein B5M48_02975 [Candidatus Omnitrophica bacterium 4484_213]|nr:MAG: hypothetical protein B5M48_02975 [Candidatus Omnitrophica bacterium 4484_213]
MVKRRIAKKASKIVKRYVQRLSQEDAFPINQVIIFGSQINGRKKWSDINVCIVSPKFKDSLQTLEYLEQKER